jgi:hypothetical protein
LETAGIPDSKTVVTAANMIEADNTCETFDQMFKAVAKHKPKQ